MDKWRNWQTLKQEKWSAILLKIRACTIPGSNPGLSTNNNQIINLMAKEVKKITGDWTKSISEMKLNEVVEFPISAYDGIMSTIRYRVRRRFGIIIKREGELDYKKGVFRAKRIS